MRMILSEALQDDLVALEAGVWCLLPNLDACGRQILYLDVARHTLNGYTSESMVSDICRHDICRHVICRHVMVD